MKQVVVSEDRIGILDLDSAVIDDPARDLGSFMAHLERDVLRGEIPPQDVEPFGAALVDGYGGVPGRDLASRIALQTATRLFRIASHPFRHGEQNWPEKTEAILNRVEEILDQAPT